MKSKRTALLKKIFAGRNLVSDAQALGMDIAVLQDLIGVAPVEPAPAYTPITISTAVAIGKLTGTSPRTIMAAQLDDELLSAGLEALALDVTSEAAAPARTPKKKTGSVPAGSRSPFGGRTSFTLD